MNTKNINIIYNADDGEITFDDKEIYNMLIEDCDIMLLGDLKAALLDPTGVLYYLTDLNGLKIGSVDYFDTLNQIDNKIYNYNCICKKKISETDDIDVQ